MKGKGMAGVNERVEEFLRGWPIAKQQLEDLIEKEDEGDSEVSE